MAAPSGALWRTKVKRLVLGVWPLRISGSLTLIGRVISALSTRVKGAGICTTGSELTSFTVTRNARVDERAAAPLSRARTVMMNWPGPCASVGVHVNTPVVGLIAAPAGGL